MTSMMTKKVTYGQSADENADYLVPLQYEYPSSKAIESGIHSHSPPSNGLFSSINLPASLLLYLPIAICQLIIGFVYIDKCPVQYLIDVWMIVSGVFGILLVILGVFIHIKVRKSSNPQIFIACFLLIFLFIVVWFFAGQVFVFEVKTYVEFFDPTLPEYCHGVLYRAAYIIIFIDYLILLLAIILNVLSYVAPPDDHPNAISSTQTVKTWEHCRWLFVNKRCRWWFFV